MKKLFFGFGACAAVALITMAQSPVSITPSLSQIYANDGTAALPSITFGSIKTVGLYNLGGANIGFSNGGVGYMGVFADVIQLKSTTSLGWSSSTLNNTTDTAITRAGAGQFGWTAVLFANLGTPSNGAFCYCSDCTIANPCASGGTGALAKRLNGAWVCN